MADAYAATAWGLLTALVFNPGYALTSRLSQRVPCFSVPRHLIVELALVVAYGALLVVGVWFLGPF